MFVIRQVETEILNILRQRRLECEHYHGHDAEKYCDKIKGDFIEAEANWFMKCESHFYVHFTFQLIYFL